MKRVVNVNLSGNAYEIEEDGFESLSDYLDGARDRLAGNPDLAEIMEDLEQSIADKAGRFLRKGKTVVATAEIEQIIEEMGPVDMPADEEPARDAANGRSTSTESEDEVAEAPGVRKLYRLTSDGEKMLFGVCAGLGAYFGLDPSIIRIVFVALVFASSGVAVLAYLLLAIVIPAAKTPQQQAAAYGAPFDAREVIDRARTRLDDVQSGRRWRSHQRNLHRQARNAGFDGIGSVVGLVVVLFGILVGLWLLTRIFHWFGAPMHIGMPYYSAIPWWMAVLMVIAGVYLIGWIFGDNSDDRGSRVGSLLAKTVQVILILLIIYLAYRLLPFVHEPINALIYRAHW